MNDREEEGEEEGLGFDEYQRKKRGSGQVPSDRNPKAAGRPSTEWREYQEFLEYKKLRDEGVTPRGLSEILNGFIGHGEGRGEGDIERDAPKYMGRILEAIGVKEKDLEKMKVNLADEQIDGILKYILSAIKPTIGKPLGWALGVTALYMIERIPITERLDKDVWDEMPSDVKEDYWDVVIEGDKVKAKRAMMYQIAHTAVDIIKWIIDVIGGWAKEEYDVGGYNPISYWKWKSEKGWRWAIGGFGVWVYLIQKRRKKVTEE